jgi:hypothetical protein
MDEADITSIKSAMRNVISLGGTPFEINDNEIFGSQNDAWRIEHRPQGHQQE